MQLIGSILFGCIWLFIILVGLFLFATTKDEWSKKRIERKTTRPLENEKSHPES